MLLSVFFTKVNIVYFNNLYIIIPILIIIICQFNPNFSILDENNNITT